MVMVMNTKGIRFLICLKNKMLEWLEVIFVTWLWLMILPIAFIFSLFEKRKKND
jgi:hypothetical protein